MMPDDFEERLRAAMRRESDRLPFMVTAADVERRLAEPSRRFPGWLALAAVPLAAALVAAVMLATPRAPGPASSTATPTPTAASLVPPPSCPITRLPDPPYVPPARFPATPPGGSWYGTNDLWTTVRPDGSWGGVRDAAGGYGNKSFWWSDAFKVDEEPEPALQVTARRLDEPAPAAHSLAATNAAASGIGSAMLTGLTLPTAGCWELTGHYRGHELSYVVWIPGADAPTAAGLPPVASCDARPWSPTLVSCADAQRSVSLGAPLRAGSGGAPLIWLTTLAAVDAYFAPGRQVADHPNDPTTQVWVFIYGERPGDRLLHVADATNPRTRDGAFIYLYSWSELGSPALPKAMPTPGHAIGCPQSSIVDPAIGTADPRAYIRVAEPLQINDGYAELWVRVVPDVEAQELLVTGYTLDGQTSGTTNGQLKRITSDQVPSDWKLAGGQFKGSVKFWQSGCWHIRIFLDGRFIGSAVLLTSSP